MNDQLIIKVQAIKDEQAKLAERLNELSADNSLTPDQRSAIYAAWDHMEEVDMALVEFYPNQQERLNE